MDKTSIASETQISKSNYRGEWGTFTGGADSRNVDSKTSKIGKKYSKDEKT